MTKISSRIVAFIFLTLSSIAFADGRMCRDSTSTGGCLHPTGNSMDIGARIENWGLPTTPTDPMFTWQRFQTSFNGPSLISNQGSFLCMARTANIISAFVVQKLCDTNDSTQLWDFSCRLVSGVRRCVITQYGANNCLYSPNRSGFQGVASVSIQVCSPFTTTNPAFLWSEF